MVLILLGKIQLVPVAGAAATTITAKKKKKRRFSYGVVLHQFLRKISFCNIVINFTIFV